MAEKGHMPGIKCTALEAKDKNTSAIIEAV
jgi:hypothetical protein